MITGRDGRELFGHEDGHEREEQRAGQGHAGEKFGVGLE